VKISSISINGCVVFANMLNVILNRVGIVLSVLGSWNIIGVFIKEDDIIANILIFVLGAMLWLVTSKYDGMEELSNVFEVPVTEEL